MYTTEGGRFARAKRLKEAKEKQLLAQQENLSTLLTRNVSNNIVAPSLAASAAVVATTNAEMTTNTTAPVANQLKVGKKTIQVPSHLQQMKQMLQETQSQEKRLKMDMSAIEKQQQITTENLTQAKLEQLQKLAASRGLTTEQLLAYIQHNQGQQVEEEEEEEEEGDQASAVNAFHSLINQQNELLEEMRQSHKQNTMHLDLMTKILLPPYHW